MKASTKYSWCIIFQVLIGLFLWVPITYQEMMVLIHDPDLYYVTGLIAYGLVNVPIFIYLLFSRRKHLRKEEEVRYRSKMLEKIYDKMDPLYGTPAQVRNGVLKDRMEILSQQERIIRAANKDERGIVWSVTNPGGHGHCYQLMFNHYGEVITADEGFVTSHGRFVDRQEGWIIAKAANQIVRICDGSENLCSENMWAPDYHA